MSDVIVEVEGVSKRFGEVSAVEDFSFRVERGQVYGLLGPNGAGKSTTLRMIMGLERPNSGVTRLFGDDGHTGLRAARPCRCDRRAGRVRARTSRGMRNLRLWWTAGGARMARRRSRPRPGHRRPRRRDPSQGQDLLAGHEATSRLRPAAARPSRAAGARRTDERLGPRRDPRDPRADRPPHPPGCDGAALQPSPQRGRAGVQPRVGDEPRSPRHERNGQRSRRHHQVDLHRGRRSRRSACAAVTPRPTSATSSCRATAW